MCFRHGLALPGSPGFCDIRIKIEALEWPASGVAAGFRRQQVARNTGRSVSSARAVRSIAAQDPIKAARRKQLTERLLTEKCSEANAS